MQRIKQDISKLESALAENYPVHKMSAYQELRLAVDIAFDMTDHIDDSGPDPLALTARYEELLRVI